MNQESKKLGRGLSSLFSGRDSDHKLDNLKYLGVSQLAPNKNQPRKNFNEGSKSFIFYPHTINIGTH